jgi:hypothetical protein
MIEGQTHLKIHLVQLSISHEFPGARPPPAAKVNVNRAVHRQPLGLATLEPALRPEDFHVLAKDVLAPHHRERVVPHGRALGDEQAVEGITPGGDDLVVAIERGWAHADAFGEDSLV